MKLNFKSLLNKLVLILSICILLFSINEVVVLNKQEDAYIFKDQADTINRMTIYQSKNSIDDKFLYDLASGYENLFLYSKAIEQYKLILENDPLSIDANFKLINLYLLESNFEAAKEIGLFLLENNINSVALYETLALIELTQENYSEAIIYIDKSLELSEDNQQKDYLNTFLELLKDKHVNSDNNSINQKIIDFIGYPAIKSELLINFYKYSSKDEHLNKSESLGQASLFQENYTSALEYFHKSINNESYSDQLMDAFILTYVLEGKIKNLNDFSKNQKHIFSTLQLEIINLIVSYEESKDDLYLKKVRDVTSSNSVKNKFYYNVLIGHLYELADDPENAKVYYYNFLNSDVIDTNNFEYWSALQKRVVSSIGEIEIKTNSLYP